MLFIKYILPETLMHFIGKNMLETILSDSQEMHISLPQSKVTIQNQIVLIINLYLIMIFKKCVHLVIQ